MLQSMVSQRVGRDLATEQQQMTQGDPVALGSATCVADTDCRGLE